MDKFKFTPQLEMCLKIVAEDLNLDMFETFRLLEQVCLENVKYIIQINSHSDQKLTREITRKCYQKLAVERSTTINLVQFFMHYLDRRTVGVAKVRNFLETAISKNNLLENVWSSYKNQGTTPISSSLNIPKSEVYK